MNTKLYYLYRDASNYKTQNMAVLEGEMTSEVFDRLLACCDTDNTFIPQNVGLDLIRDWEYDPQEDHPWCELESFELCSESASSGLTVQELLDSFEQRRNNWDDVTPALMEGF